MNSILAFAVGSLWRRRSRAIALGVGLALTVTLVASVLFLTEALRGEAERSQVALPDVVVQRLVAGRPTAVRVADAKALESIDSVRDVRPRVWGYVFLPALQGNVTIVGVARGVASLDGTAALERGRDLAIGKHEMVAGAPLARALGLVVGDSLGLPSPKPTPPLTLVGTFGSAVDLYAADVVVCDEDDARAILGLAPDQATDLAIDVKNPEEARVVAGTVLDRMPGARVVEKKILERVYTLAYGRRAGLIFAACIPALIALVVLALDRASGLSPVEKREIAISEGRRLFDPRRPLGEDARVARSRVARDRRGALARVRVGFLARRRGAPRRARGLERPLSADEPHAGRGFRAAARDCRGDCRAVRGPLGRAGVARGDPRAHGRDARVRAGRS